MAKNNLIGKRFGKLTVIEETPKRINRCIVWRCLCDCGEYTEVRSTSLTSGHTCSCGCLQKERSSESARKDIANQKFGLLTALYPTDKRAPGGGSVVWMCKCDCGNNFEARATDLRYGHVQSCGCSNESKGERAIRQMLTASHIPFTTEQSFTTCIFPDSGKYARFDFYVNNTYLIEFDGKQHYQEDGGFFPSAVLEKTQTRDAFKNQWCKDNNIPLIRIPYNHLKQLTITDLLLETSNFIVK